MGMESGMSLADAMALTSGKQGDSLFGGNGILALIVIFILLFGNGGFGGFGGRGAEVVNVQDQIRSGFDTNTIVNKLDNLGNGLSDIGYAQLSGFNGVGSAIADLGYRTQACCCETNRNIDNVRYENAKNTCDIVTANNAGVQRILDAMKQNEIDTLRTQLQTVQLGASNQAQSTELLNILGKWYSNPCVNPYTAYGCCGAC